MHSKNQNISRKSHSNPGFSICEWEHPPSSSAVPMMTLPELPARNEPKPWLWFANRVIVHSCVDFAPFIPAFLCFLQPCVQSQTHPSFPNQLKTNIPLGQTENLAELQDSNVHYSNIRKFLSLNVANIAQGLGLGIQQIHPWNLTGLMSACTTPSPQSSPGNRFTPWALKGSFVLLGNPHFGPDWNLGQFWTGNLQLLPRLRKKLSLNLPWEVCRASLEWNCWPVKDWLCSLKGNKSEYI